VALICSPRSYIWYKSNNVPSARCRPFLNTHKDLLFRYIRFVEVILIICWLDPLVFLWCSDRGLAGDVASQRGELADGVGRVFLGAWHLQEDNETYRGWQPIVHGPGSAGDGPGRDREELRQESQSVVKEMERAHRERCFIHFLLFSSRSRRL